MNYDFFSISFTKLPKQMNAFQLTGLASLATQKSETIDMTENSRDRSWEIAKGVWISCGTAVGGRSAALQWGRGAATVAWVMR